MSWAVGNRLAMRARTGLIALLVGGLLGVVGDPSAAFAYVASCNPGRSHDNAARYVITTGSVSGINGLTSNILELDPYYSGSNGTGTNSTIMLVNSSLSQWAQLGWFKSKIHYGFLVTREAGLEFYLSSSQNYFQWFGGRSVQTQTWYEILFETGSKFNFFVGGSYVANYSGFTPSAYQMFSETHDLADQMPGTTSNVETFRSSGYFTGSGHGTSHTITGSIGTDTRYYGGQNLGGGTYYAFDLCGAAALSQPAAGGAVADATSISPQHLSIPPWSAPDATLSAGDLSLFGIQSAIDVTDSAASTDTASATTSVTRAQAVETASNEVNLGTNMRVYAAAASRSPGAPAQPVWIVTTSGGTVPFDGPAGGPSVPPARLTAVIIDATTGAFWRGFMH